MCWSNHQKQQNYPNRANHQIHERLELFKNLGLLPVQALDSRTTLTMQTFLPLPSFKKSAEVLDYKRLGNQRNEAKLCYEIITHKRVGGRWKGHPCVKMWAPYPNALALYFNEICKAWENSGYINNIARLPINQNTLKFPPWLGHPDFHSSHRAALLYKNYEWYSQFGWCEQPELKYLWPIYDEALTFKLMWI